MTPPRCFVALLAILLPVVAEPPARAVTEAERSELAATAPSAEAKAARTNAESLFTAGKVDEALSVASTAVKLAPTWPEAYELRARIELALTGPGADLAGLAQPDPKRDYKPMALALRAAKSDLEHYFHLAPAAAEKEGTLQLLIETSTRLALADKIVAAGDLQTQEAKRAQQAKEVEKAQAAAEKARVEAEAKRQAEETERQVAEHERLVAEQNRQIIAKAQKDAFDQAVQRTTMRRRIGCGLAAGAVVAAGVAIGLSVASNGDYNALKTEKIATGGAQADLKIAGDHLASGTLAAALVSGALGLAAIPLIWLNLPPHQAKLSLAPTQNGLAVAVSGNLP